MGPYEQFLHLANFAAPALFIALLLPWAGRWMRGKGARAQAWWAQAAALFAVGVVVLLAGLAFFGVDGKMATYAALVVACAAAQWLMGRGWR